MTKEIKETKVEVKERELKQASGGVDTPIRRKRSRWTADKTRPKEGKIGLDERRKP